MTLLDERPSTATGPTARTVGRSARGPVVVGLVLVLTAIAAASFSATGERGRLDPNAYNPAGAHAIAQLLTDRGVPVRKVLSVADVQGREDTTVVVPVPQALTDGDLARIEELPGELVVVGGDMTTLMALGLPVTAGPPVPVEDRRPACDLPAAVRAGDADSGGQTYRATGSAEAVGCYASSGRASLVRLPAQRLTLLGSGDLLTNARLDKRGNAALALGLLGTGSDVQWVLPRPGSTASEDSLNDLIPRGLKLAVLQLLLAVGVVALWRARSLGRPVSEPLPVVVRAAEAVEGRSRLYRAARARGTAAEQLRAGARDRLVRRLGMGLDTGRAGLVDAVSVRTRRDAAAVDALLYGAGPGSVLDDASLVRLAGDLDSLISEVADS